MEHRVVDARHQRCILWERRRQGDILFLELRSGIGQIQLIEHAMLPVLGQGTPVLFSEGLALGEEPTKVRALCQFVAIQGLVDTIVAHLIVTLAHRNHVDTLARFQGYMPVVLRHTRDDMVV